MSTLRELAAKATAPPWHALHIAGTGEPGSWCLISTAGRFDIEIDPKEQADAAYIVALANAAPLYFALEDAARMLANEAATAVTEPRRFHENEDSRQQRLGRSVSLVRAALDKVGETEP